MKLKDLDKFMKNTEKRDTQISKDSYADSYYIPEDDLPKIFKAIKKYGSTKQSFPKKKNEYTPLDKNQFKESLTEAGVLETNVIRKDRSRIKRQLGNDKKHGNVDKAIKHYQQIQNINQGLKNNPDEDYVGISANLLGMSPNKSDLLKDFRDAKHTDTTYDNFYNVGPENMAYACKNFRENCIEPDIKVEQKYNKSHSFNPSTIETSDTFRGNSTRHNDKHLTLGNHKLSKQDIRRKLGQGMQR